MNHSAKNFNQSLCLIGFVTCLFLFALLTFIVKAQPNLYLNALIHQYIANNIQSPMLSYISLLISLFGDKYVVVSTVTVSSLLLFVRGQKRFAVHFFLVIVLAAVLTSILKNTLVISRPGVFSYTLNKYAFPSRHVTLCSTYLIFFSALIMPKLKCYRWLGLSIIVIIILESFARLALGVHWLTDVVGGILLGTACGLIGAYSYHSKPDSLFNPCLIFNTFIIIFCILSILYLSIFWHALLLEYQIK